MLIVDVIRRLSAYARRQPGTGRVTLALNALSLGLLVFCFLILALNASKGFDITDESFYLLWAGQPHSVAGVITPFGFVTGILYRLVGESIPAFRIAGLLLLLSAAFFFAHAFKRYWDQKFSAIGSLSLFGAVLIGLAGVLFYYGPWILTPSYNWLALLGTLLAISGLLYFSVSARRTVLFWVAVAMVASGGVLAFIAKPTTGLLLAFMAVLWISVEGRNRHGLRFMLSSATLAALLLLIFVRAAYGALSSCYESFRFGLELGAALGAGHTTGETVVRSRDQILAFLRWWIETPFVSSFIGLSVVLSILGVLRRRVRPYVNSLLLSAALVLHIYLVFRDLPVSTVLLSVQGYLLLVFFRFMLIEKSSHIAAGMRRACMSRGLFLVLFYLLAAFAVAFGTAINIIRHVSLSSVFVAVSILVVLHLLTALRSRGVFVGVYGLVLAVLLTMMVTNAYDQPYRLAGSIGEQRAAVSFLNPRQHLQVDAPTAAYVEGLKAIAVDAGWQAGMPLIDMTGGSPGALVILDARILGTPWLLGGYRGSGTFARKALQSVDQSILDDAWILTAPEGRRRLDDRVLTDSNLGFPEGYAVVGSVTTAHRNEKQFLWKPRQGD